MLINNSEYFQLLENIKSQIRHAKYKAVLSLNREQILLYWSIGKSILQNKKYGNNFIENLSRDIRSEFPESSGFSVRNLQYMRKFAELFDDFENLQVPLADLTWYHIQRLMNKVSDKTTFLWYARKTVENGWSSNVLMLQIEKKLYERQASENKVSNFEYTLPSPQSELARDTMKNQYIFDFIGVREKMIERDIENELVLNITKTLLELGTGFAFIGNQYHICVGNADYYIDLLFYHTKLRCYVVIELKARDFKPRDAGQINFYLSAVDDLLRHEQDNPTIGLVLCLEKDNFTAEYALRDINKPVGVSDLRLSDYLPKELENSLPTAEDIKRRIERKYEITEEE